MIAHALKEKENKAIVMEIEDTINCFGLDTESELNAVLADMEATRLLEAIGITWILTGAENAGKSWTMDARNEYAMNLCKEFAGYMNPTDYYKVTDKAMVMKANNIVAELFRMHRTLQQRFTQIVFTFLRKLSEMPEHDISLYDPALRAMDQKYQYKWENCPFI